MKICFKFGQFCKIKKSGFLTSFGKVNSSKNLQSLNADLDIRSSLSVMALSVEAEKETFFSPDRANAESPIFFRLRGRIISSKL